MNETEQILTSILNCRCVDLYADKPQLTVDQKIQFENMMARRKDGEPLQYILGSANFMGLELKVNPDVLIPRPETELMVELALQKIKIQNLPSVRILDLGTGSGNIAIALAKNLKNAFVTSMDIFSKAIALAKDNAAFHNVSEKIYFCHLNMTNFLELPEAMVNKFDIIISNPPYIKTDLLETLPIDVKQEPKAALDGGEDGLYFIRRIILNAAKFLKPQGLLIFEIGEDQADQIQGILNHNLDYQQIEVHKDYTNADRIITALRQPR